MYDQTGHGVVMYVGMRIDPRDDVIVHDAAEG